METSFIFMMNAHSIQWHYILWSAIMFWCMRGGHFSFCSIFCQIKLLCWFSEMCFYFFLMKLFLLGLFWYDLNFFQVFLGLNVYLLFKTIFIWVNPPPENNGLPRSRWYFEEKQTTFGSCHHAEIRKENECGKEVRFSSDFSSIRQQKS